MSFPVLSYREISQNLNMIEQSQKEDSRIDPDFLGIFESSINSLENNEQKNELSSRIKRLINDNHFGNPAHQNKKRKTDSGAPISLSNAPVRPLKELKKEYIDDPKKEIQRLRDKKIFNPDLEFSIDKILSGIDSVAFPPINNTEEVKVTLGRALEIKECLKKTHFTLTHGQDTRWMIALYVLKEVLRDSYPEKNLKDFKFLRFPKIDNRDTANLSQFKNKPGLSDHAKEVRDELISCDAYFLNDSSGESALYYLKNNLSILSHNSQGSSAELIIADRVLAILKQIFPENPDAYTKVADVAVKAIGKLSNYNLGSFHVISVPKEAIKNDSYIYRSHPFGVDCHCEPIRKLNEFSVLELLQDDYMSNDLKCQYGSSLKIPQFRLLSSRLRPGEDIYVKSFTPVPKEIRKQIKADIRAAISA